MKVVSIMETKKCVGCGSILQCEDDSKVGYVPKLKYASANYCKRCFKLINYNEKVLHDLQMDDSQTIEKVNKTENYVFFLVDFLNISDETINTFKKIKNDKTLIISKCDLIFKDINLDKIKNNIENIYNIKDNIIFLSSKKNYNINLIFSILKKNNRKKAYILGYTNAGKSTLINSLKKEDKIAMSTMPNTTLDFIEMNIEDYKIIDTPGFNLKNTFYNNDEFDLIKKVNPVYFVSPITYKTKDNQIFKVEDRLYLKDFKDNSITFYISNLIKIKKIYKDDDIKYTKIDIDNNSDIVIASLGFINVKKKCSLLINEDMINVIEIRNSIIYH